MDRKSQNITVDSSQAKIVAYIVVAGFLAIMLVFGIKSSNQRLLHQGDVEKSLPCPVCDGVGEIENQRCPYCLGAKKVKAVIPGPNHPVRVRGSVRDLSHFKDRQEAESVVTADGDYSQVILKPQRGAVGGAVIEFNKGDHKSEIVVKPSGRYSGLLVPGSYQVSVVHSDFQTTQSTLVVPSRQHLVWPKMPGMTLEDEELLEENFFLTPLSR